MSAPIRVSLEPGYDHGRVGAWMLDLPGCFAWGTTEAEALSRVSGAVHRYLDRLEAHGERVERRPDTDETDVVERVAPTWIPDGDGTYERNATFAGDRRAVAPDELERTVARLEAAYADVRAAAARLEEHEQVHGSLPTRSEEAATAPPGPRRQRSSGSLLRHIAGAQMWLASRLDREERYAGAGPDEPQRYLEETHRWVLERLGQLHAVDPAMAAEDGKGETWTLAKVCRRLVYHVHDHLDELERRLDLAAGAVDRLEVRREAPPTGSLERLLRRTAFASRAADPERLRRMLAGSTETWSLWDGDALVAFARVLTDGAFNAYVLTVAVDPAWQGRGAGTRLMESLLADRDHLSFALGARSGVDGFYRGLGFLPATWMMARRRTR